MVSYNFGQKASYVIFNATSVSTMHHQHQGKWILRQESATFLTLMTFKTTLLWHQNCWQSIWCCMIKLKYQTKTKNLKIIVTVFLAKTDYVKKLNQKQIMLWWEILQPLKSFWKNCRISIVLGPIMILALNPEKWSEGLESKLWKN